MATKHHVDLDDGCSNNLRNHVHFQPRSPRTPTFKTHLEALLILSLFSSFFEADKGMPLMREVI